MDPILWGFALIAAGASAGAVFVWWRRRPWTAAVIAVVALLAATPLTRVPPDAVTVAGLLVVLGAAGAATVWPLLRPARSERGVGGGER